ncbi:helix-turn-helix domain-containing protein [Actinomadura sp. LOL_016]|uniref:helix-turn-helix domain-containing protein n=1 Tax=unclassified Actinomadura TaxID=2626254 RepID=UPI003A803DE0
MRQSPTVRLRRLSNELRSLREKLGLTVAEAARRADWAQSKLSRAENRQWRQPVIADLERLLDVYGLTEETQPARREDLLQLARDARRRGWWAGYSISDAYSTYVGFEAEASVIRTHEPLVIPGLLQCAAYARALISSRDADLTPEDVDHLVALRMQRQARLVSVDPINLRAVLGEEVLRRLVGGTAVMAEQLAHLYKIAQQPHVQIQVLPLSAGAAPIGGPFSIFTFMDDPLDPESVYVESIAGDLWVEDPQQVARYLRGWARLVDAALPVPASLSVIEARASYLKARAHGADPLA